MMYLRLEKGCDRLNHLTTQPLHPALQAVIQMGLTRLPTDHSATGWSPLVADD